MRVCKHVFFPAEKYFWDFFSFFYQKNIDIVVFCVMIYIVRRYT